METNKDCSNCKGNGQITIEVLEHIIGVYEETLKADLWNAIELQEKGSRV